MQLELILGYLLIIEYTQIYNYIVYLYVEYKKLYAAIGAMLSSAQTTMIDVHDGIYQLEVPYVPGYIRLVGIVDDIFYFRSSSSASTDTISDGTTIWNISITDYHTGTIMKVEGGWIIAYNGFNATSASGNTKYVKYTDSFVATTTTIDIPEVGRARDFEYRSPLVGFDGRYLYVSCQYEKEYLDDPATDVHGLSIYGSPYIAVIDFTTGLVTRQDSKLGITWGSNFYPIDGNMIYADKPILTPWLVQYAHITNGRVPYPNSVRFGCIFFGLHYMDVSLISRRNTLYFDGNCLYLNPKMSTSDRFGGFNYVLKKKII